MTVTDQAPKLRLPKDAWNRRNGRGGWFTAGTVVVISGALPISVGLILNAFGVTDIGSGLGLGLIFYFCCFIAAVLFAVGAISERAR